MKKTNIILFGVLLVSSIFISACADEKETTPTPTTPTLYEKLGGTTMVADPANSGQMIEQGRLGLRSVVDSTIFVIAGDNELQPYFQVLLAEVGSGNVTGFTALSKNLTDFFCVATGAKNFTYNGIASMVAAHDPAQNNRMGLKADNAAYNKFVADVVAGAAQNGVTDPAIISELGAVLESLRTTIVQR
jgi:hypothetical protein